MLKVISTREFVAWLRRLRDHKAKAKVLARIERLALGNAGDVKPIGGGLSELRIDHGPGYRIYFARRGNSVIVLIAGGDKSSQSRDIARAHIIYAKCRDEI